MVPQDTAIGNRQPSDAQCYEVVMQQQDTTGPSAVLNMRQLFGGGEGFGLSRSGMIT